MPELVVSNADRVIYPDDGFTKGDVVEHYRRVGAMMLPHIRDRPLTLKRFPKGIHHKGFFQKNAGRHFPDFIDRIEMPKRNGVTCHPAVKSGEGLTYLANQGTIAFHMPLSQRPDLGRPDRMVLDLDPAEGDTHSARRAAWAAKLMLDAIGIESAPMVTGSKGYHVVVALKPAATCQSVATAARTLAAVMIQDNPSLLTEAFRKKRRDGRVFVDWMRNGFGATVVAPWSLRPLPTAPVAVPIAWDDLDATAPNAFTLETVASRLESGDPILQLEPAEPTSLIHAAAALADERKLELEPFDRFRS